MTTIARRITGGVDTHLDVHVAAALDERGALLGVESFATTAAGYRDTACAGSGPSGPSSWSASKAPAVMGRGSPVTCLHQEVAVVEVDRPNRQRRRRTGKSDPEDAVAAARAAQGGDATGSAKTRDGNVEAMRVLRVARSSARSSRTQAINQMRSLVSTAPDELRAELRDLSIYKVLALASAYRHTGRTDVTTLTKLTLRTLARRALALEEEVKEIDRLLEDPGRRDRPGAERHRRGGHRRGLGPLGGRRRQPRAPEERSPPSPSSAGSLLSTPRAASSSDTGSTAAGTARPTRPSGTSCFTRMVCDPRTQHYIERRMKEGRTKKEAIRCLKRYVVREVFARSHAHNSLLTIHRSIDRGYPDGLLGPRYPR